MEDLRVKQMILKIDGCLACLNIFRKTKNINSFEFLTIEKKLLELKLFLLSQKSYFIEKSILEKASQNHEDTEKVKNPKEIANENKKRILDYFKINSLVSNFDLFNEFTEFNPRTLRRYLREMIESGQIKRNRQGNDIKLEISQK